MGRPVKTLPNDFEYMVEDWKNGKMDMDEILEVCQISKSTFYRKIK